MDNFGNNPFLSMFKQSFDNPMNVWSQACESMKKNDYTKAFNPANWMEMTNQMMENLPWAKSFTNMQENDVKKAFNFAEHIKGMESFSELSHLVIENTQAMLHRQAEIIQRHSAELYKAWQNISSASNHSDNLDNQKEYLRSSFEALLNDFKDLAEMYSKASLETFEAASTKMTHHMGCKGKKCSSAHHHGAEHREEEHHDNAKEHRNKKK